MKQGYVLGLLAVCLAVCLVPTQGNSRTTWVNNYHRNFQFSCRDSFIGRVISTFSQSQKDRRYKFYCSNTPYISFGNCKWSGTQNALKNTLFFSCPKNQVLTGVKATYYNYDRTFSFQCCEAPGQILHSCKLTPYIGRIVQTSDYQVPANHVLIGMYSNFYKNFNDRKFRYQVCKVADELWF